MNECKRLVGLEQKNCQGQKRKMLASTKLSKQPCLPHVWKNILCPSNQGNPLSLSNLLYGMAEACTEALPGLLLFVSQQARVAAAATILQTTLQQYVVRTSCMVTQGNQEWLERKEEEKFSLFFLDLRTNLSSFSFNHCLCNGFHAIASHLSLLLDLPSLYLFHYYTIW